MKCPHSDIASSRSEPRADCLVVMYHYVRPPVPEPELALPALDLDRFEQQLDRLAAGREIITVQTYLDYLEGRSDLPSRAALLTFDDGLIDHARHVLPALRRRGMTGAFFVQTEPLERQCMEAAHMNHLLLARLDFDELIGEFESALGAETPHRRLADYCDRDTALRLYHYETEPRALYKYAIAFGLPFELRDRILERLFSRHVGDPREHAGRFYLSWSQLAEMRDAGMHIGGHSHPHDPYTRMTNSRIKADVSTCARILSARLGFDTRTFSYPYGRFDRGTTEAVRDAGFAAAFTTADRSNTGPVDRYRIARVDCIHLDPYLSDPAEEAAHARA